MTDPCVLFRNESTAIAMHVRRVLVRKAAPGLLDDLVQETLLQAWTRMLDGGFVVRAGSGLLSSILAWVATIARREFFDMCRRRRRRVEVEYMEEQHGESARCEGCLEAREILERAEGLDDDLRTAIRVLAEGEGIGERLGPNAERTMHRLRDRLATMVDPEARKAIWSKAPTMTIRRQRSTSKRVA